MHKKRKKEENENRNSLRNNIIINIIIISLGSRHKRTHTKHTYERTHTIYEIQLYIE